MGPHREGMGTSLSSGSMSCCMSWPSMLYKYSISDVPLRDYNVVYVAGLG